VPQRIPTVGKGERDVTEHLARIMQHPRPGPAHRLRQHSVNTRSAPIALAVSVTNLSSALPVNPVACAVTS